MCASLRCFRVAAVPLTRPVPRQRSWDGDHVGEGMLVGEIVEFSDGGDSGKCGGGVQVWQGNWASRAAAARRAPAAGRSSHRRDTQVPAPGGGDACSAPPPLRGQDR